MATRDQFIENLMVGDVIAHLSSREVWRVVVKSPNYEVSSFGSVRRIGAKAPLKPGITCGYAHVCLSRNGVVKVERIHILVAMSFLGAPPFIGAIVAHNDGQKLNNKISNLRWASALENQRDRTRHHTGIFGSDVHNAKLCEADIPLIRNRVNDGERYRQIADSYGVSISTISLIKRGKIWKRANGATWRPE